MKKQIRTAFVHDWLISKGGAENVLAAMLDLYPGAPVYTLVHDPNGPCSEFLEGHPVFTSFYNMKKRVPKIHQHDGDRARLLGVDLLDRTIVVYAFEADLGDGWEDPEVHNVPVDMREKALRMGVNVIAWYLQGQRSK